MPDSVDQSITAALEAEAVAAAQRREALARALSQSMAPPLDINPFLRERVLEDTQAALARAGQQIFIGAVPENHPTVSLVFLPAQISGQQVYFEQVYVP